MVDSHRSEKRVSKMTKTGTRVTRACTVCRRRKIKCDGIVPCGNCMSSGLICSFDAKVTKCDSLYRQEDDIRRELRLLTQYTKGIENLTSISSSKLKPFITELENKLNEFRDDLRLSLEKRSIGGYNEKSSIETKLIEVNPPRFTHFNNQFGKNTSLIPINSYFGLYSPLTLFSKDGFGWLFKKLIKSHLDKTETKKTFYLYLKYFDLSSLWYERAQKQISSPLDWYREYYLSDGQLGISDSKLIKLIFGEVINELSLKNFDINNLENLSPDVKLEKLIELKVLHTKYFRDETNLRDLNAENQFVKTNEYLNVLSIELIQRSSLLSIYSENIIQSVLTFLELTHWKKELGSLRKYATPIISRAIECGFNRWEYNIGKPESKSENSRLTWWKCYWWDKWISLLTGKPFMIDDSQTSCLLPKSWMKNGIDEKMDCDMLIKSFNFSKASESDVFDQALRYIISKILHNSFCSVLYNPKFTDYSLCSTNFQNHEECINELIIQINDIITLLDTLEERTNTYFQDISPNEARFETCLTFFYNNVLLFSAMQDLLFRVTSLSQLREDLSEANILIEKCSAKSAEFSVECLRRIKCAKDLVDKSKFYQTIGILFIKVVVYCIDHPEHNRLGYVTSMCETLSSFANKDTVSCSLSLNMSYVEARQANLALYFSFILLRIFLQLYSHSEKCLSFDDLASTIGLRNAEAGMICKDLQDITSPYFKMLLDDIQEGGLHKGVLSVINIMTNSQFFENFNKSSILNDISANSQKHSFNNHNSEFLQIPADEIVAATNLSDFLSLDIFPDVYNVMWGDTNSPLPQLE